MAQKSRVNFSSKLHLNWQVFLEALASEYTASDSVVILNMIKFLGVAFS